MKKEMAQKLKSLTILYVEDEQHIRDKIADTLKYYVKEVFTAKDGEEGFLKYKEKSPDIILSDILMPKVNGIEMVQKIREKDFFIPIIMITAHTEKEHLLSAVKLQLENYLIKPITLQNILKVLTTCLEKITKLKTINCDLPKGYSYDIDHKLLTFNNEIIKLSKKEIKFLELLLYNEQRVVKYEELQEYVWEDDFMTDNAVRSLVCTLRNKLPKSIISNLSGIGYKLEND